MLRRLLIGRRTVLASALGAILLLGSGAVLAADTEKDRQKCAERIHKSEENLRKQIDRHGAHSRQANNARRHLDEQREKCRQDYGGHDNF